MTAPTKPRKPRAKPLAVAPPPTDALSPLEARVVRALRTMDDKGAWAIDAIAARYVQDFPRRASTALSLVAGGAQ